MSRGVICAVLTSCALEVSPLYRDVDSHLAACPECQLFLDQLRTSVELVGGLPSADDLPESTIALLVQHFRRFTGD